MTKELRYPGSLHNHTDFSNFRLRDSINTVEELINGAIEMNHSCVAITEHETIASSLRALRHYKKIKENHPDFKVILGNEIYLCRNGLNANNFNRETDRYYHFILLAKDAIGHEQIREISTRAWDRSYLVRNMRRVPTYYDDLAEVIGRAPGHVIGSTACLGGALPTQLLKGKRPQVEVWCQQLQGIFGKENFYLEMQPSDNTDQRIVNNQIILLSEKLDIPYIITNDAHYLKKTDAPIHKAFLTSQNGDREVDAFYATTYLMETDEVCSFMTRNGLTEENISTAFLNIEKIKNMVEDFSLEKPLKIPVLDWKKVVDVTDKKDWIENIPFLERFWESEFKSDVHLADVIVERLLKDTRLYNETTFAEVDKCLNDIWISSEVNKTRWSAYLLNLENIIDICWEAGSLVGAGRGSGVGFLLLYLLEITQINPLWEKSPTRRFRFLNPHRASPLDIDIDIEGSKRQNVLAAFRKRYGDDRVANVLTLGTEKSKSAILTSARGLGIDIDIAQYLASMIVSDRGALRTLHQTFYGDPENDMAPNKQFQNEMTNNYPELWAVAQKIEGLICRAGIHAGGVIFVDESFTKSTALMKAPNGETIVQFDLHDCESAGLIKYDILSIEALDKIHNCLDLLVESGHIQEGTSLKETYEKTIGVYNLTREDEKMWEMVHNHEIISLFQMEEQSGLQGIATLKPTSVDDLAVLNSTIRLMAQEKGGEMPTQKLARFKADKEAWDEELIKYGLNESHKKILEPILGISYGLCITQEQFMELVQLPELGSFPLEFADRLRKSIAKKSPKDYELITKEFYSVTKEKGVDSKLAFYVWEILIAMSKGYGFNMSHTLAYSIIGLQEMNLAYRYPTIYWNCACLINFSGGSETVLEEEEELDTEEMDETDETKDYSFDAESFNDDDDDDDDDEEGASLTKTVKKKKARNANFGKVAIAIGKIRSVNIEVTPPHINKSTYTFTPDLESNTIRYGLSGITRVGEDLIKEIILKRPYTGLTDFLERVKVNKLQAINLIKSGAFDCFGERKDIMRAYIAKESGPKKRVTLQNLKMLIDFKLLPEDLSIQQRIFNFNKYLKKLKNGDYYVLDEVAYNFFEKAFGIDYLLIEKESFHLRESVWKKIYKKQMDIIRPFVKDNAPSLLEKLNNKLLSQLWDKYCKGTYSKWEMDSVSFLLSRP